MQTSSITRYFLFTRLKPKKEDYIHLVEESKRIDAHILYKTDTSDPQCKVLKGLIILCGPPTFPDVLHNNFPNFTITTIPSKFELDFWNIQGVFKVGEHPYEEVKKTLFKSLFDVPTLSSFMQNERNNTDIRKMVPASITPSNRN